MSSSEAFAARRGEPSAHTASDGDPDRSLRDDGSREHVFVTRRPDRPEKRETAG
jgi:hypothetical protein